MTEFNAFCRTCIHQFENDPSEVLTECYNIFKTKNLAKKIFECSQLAVSPTDGYPQWICKNCYKTIVNFTEFQRTCRDSAAVFQEMLTIGKQDNGQVAISRNKLKDSKKFLGLKKSTKINVRSKFSNDGKYILDDSRNDDHLISLTFDDTMFEDSFENDDDVLFETDLERRNQLNDVRDFNREESIHTNSQVSIAFEKDFEAPKKDIEAMQEVDHLKKLTHKDFENNTVISRQIYKCGVKNCSLEYSTKLEIHLHLREQHCSGRKFLEKGLLCNGMAKERQEIPLKQNKRTKVNQTISNSELQSSSNDEEDEEFILGGCKNRQKTHQGRVTIECEICEKQFRYRHRFEAHMRRHQGLRGYPCTRENCERTFNRLSYLQIHLNDHDGIPRTIYKCDIENCDRSYSCKSGLRSHKRLCHSGKSASDVHICETCGAVLKSAGSLKSHLLAHLDKSKWQFVCDVEGCNKRFKVVHHLKVHKRRHAGIKNYACPYCDKRFVTSSNMNNHINHHTSEKTWNCDFCPKICKNPANLRTHIRRVHEQRPSDDAELIRTLGFNCSFCEKAFPSAKSKMYHEFIHTGEKPYACEECGKNFRQPAGLKIHMKTHKKDAIRRFVCGECGRAYFTIHSLKNHEMKHTGEKPFECNECELKFIWKSNLNRHQKLHKLNSLAKNNEIPSENFAVVRLSPDDCSGILERHLS